MSADTNPDQPADHSTQLAEDRTGLARARTRLAFDRTRMASERTMMAWVRTSLSLIAFGFGLDQLASFLMARGTMPEDASGIGVQNLGLALVAMGAGLLAVATVQHYVYIRRLRAQAPHDLGRSAAGIAALLLLVVGLIGLVGLFLRANLL